MVMTIETPHPDTVTHTVTEIGDLALYLESSPEGDAPPALHISDGGGSIKIGAPDDVAALAEALMRLQRPRIDRDVAAMVTEHRSAIARARATHCGIPGCRGEGHDPEIDEAHWDHVVSSTEQGRLEASIVVDRERAVRAEIYLTDIDDRLTTEHELIALAAELRSYARMVDAQITALEIHRTAVRAVEDRARRS